MPRRATGRRSISVISITFVFPAYSYSFQRLAAIGEAGGRRDMQKWRCPGNARASRAERSFMRFQHIAGAAYRALTARKDGPSLYDVCDPLLKRSSGGDPHLAKFYKTALGNPALRPLLRRTGLIELRDEATLRNLREALIRARDEEAPTGPRSARRWRPCSTASNSAIPGRSR